MKTLHKIILFFLFIILVSLVILLGKSFYPKPVIKVEKPKHAAGAPSTTINGQDVNELTVIPEPSTWLILGGMIATSMALKYYYSSTYKKKDN